MAALRTPESRFANLPDYPFAENYCELSPGGLRMHYVDEGPREANPVLMLHGEPTWSYLYRHMIPLVAAAGSRVIAPDLIGFGKSDKPSELNDYSYANHMAWLTNLIVQLDLRNITLFCQDWGSLLGLRLAAEHPDRFAAIVVGNGMLPTGDQAMPKAFKIWKNFALYSPWFPISRIVASGCFNALSSDERAAYDAPFPSSRFKAGARAFPRLVPTAPNDPATGANRAAWQVLEQWQKPFLTCFSKGDPITRGGDVYMRARIPGANDQPHITVRGGHFLQENSPKELSEAINALVKTLR